MTINKKLCVKILTLTLAAMPSAWADGGTQLRAHAPDLGGVTGTPYTVDAGHFQIDSELINYAYTKVGTVKVTSMALNNINIRAGITSDLELEVAPVTYIRRSIDDGVTPKSSGGGFGDVAVRAKYNFLGNNGGDVAVALIPSVTIPTSTGGVGNSSLGGGLAAPVSYALPAGFGLTAMPQVMLNKAGEDYVTTLGASFQVGHEIIAGMSGFAEFSGAWSLQEGSSWLGNAAAGASYAINANTMVNAGSYFGISDSAADFNPFAGVSLRF